MSRDIAYSIRSLIQSYGGGTVLDIPTRDISSGEVCILCGPNGGGKSTLLSVLALLLPPVSGSLRLYGIEAAGHYDRRLMRKVTLVHQKPILFSTTVRNNIGYGLHAVGLSSREIRDRVERILEKANLREISEKQTRRLSGGEAQRVALARALVLQTPIVLLDEPTNSLDVASRPLLYEMLKEANEKGTTIVVASHDSDILVSLNPRILRIEKGKIA